MLRLIHTQGGREYHSTSKRRWKANIIFTWPIEVVTFSPMATHNNTKTALLPTITSPYKPRLYQNTRVSFGSHNLNFVAPLPLPPQTEGEEGVACGYQQVGVLKWNRFATYIFPPSPLPPPLLHSVNHLLSHHLCPSLKCTKPSSFFSEQSIAWNNISEWKQKLQECTQPHASAPDRISIM